ncbi:N-acetylmuramic acid 6-phosphate etherase [Virgibacillus halodenitrificans]|nr:N-acetylmuramic acid 6-phosphate etherase [Virgibacillus halodenitrificans]
MCKQTHDLTTEMKNEKSNNLHEYSTKKILQLMNEEDKSVPLAVEHALPKIEEAIELMVSAISSGHRVLYFGAGTSGRLGVLDASECPPTFGVSENLFQGVIAGGDRALRHAIENAEDSEQSGEEDVANSVEVGDIVVGIAASGHTPYVIGAMKKANKMGVRTVGITCNKDTTLSELVDVSIELVVGSEIITGSTRLKAGTAQKLTLNMLSTATMIRTGKVYKNLMVNVQATNQKLRNRSIEIIKDIAEVDEETARIVNEKANGDLKVSILVLLLNLSIEEAKLKLEKNQGNIAKALST